MFVMLPFILFSFRSGRHLTESSLINRQKMESNSRSSLALQDVLRVIVAEVTIAKVRRRALWDSQTSSNQNQLILYK